LAQAIFAQAATGQATEVSHAPNLFCGPRPAPQFAMRVEYWTGLLTLASYALLIPGLTGLIISIEVDLVVPVTGIRVDATPESHGRAGPVTLSMLRLVRVLFGGYKETGLLGNLVGCIFLVVYAIGIPIVKLVLLVSAEFQRRSTDERRRICAWRTFHFIGYISKWASPDMFSYMLIWYMTSSLDHRPVIEANVDLGFGFMCYSAFCVASTLLGMNICEMRRDQMRPNADAIIIPAGADAIWRRLCLVAVMVFVASFFVIFVVGLMTPCLALRLHLEEIPRLNYMQRRALSLFGVDKFLATDASVWQFVSDLWQRAQLPHLGVNVCLIMFAVFVIAIPAMDMMALLITAMGVATGSNDLAYLAMRVANALQHASMLDVCCAGLLAGAIATDAYESRFGLHVNLQPGLWVLFGAEAVHYATRLLVSGMLRPFVDKPSAVEPLLA